MAKKQDTLGDRITRNVEALRLTQKKSVREVAAYCGMSHSTYYARRDHPEDWTAGEVNSLAKFFKVKAADICSKEIGFREVAS